MKFYNLITYNLTFYKTNNNNIDFVTIKERKLLCKEK